MWICYTAVIRDSFFKKIRLYFKIIVESHAAVRNNRDPMYTSPRIFCKVTPCKIIVQYYNQNIDIGTAKIQNSFTIRIPFVVL